MKCQLRQILRIPLFWNMKPVGCQLWQLYSAFIFSDLKVREERPHSSLTSRIPSGSGVISQKNGIPPPQSQIIHGTHMHQTCLPAIYNYRLVHGCSDKRLDLSWKGNRFESRLYCRLLWCRILWYFSVEIPWKIWNVVLQKEDEDQLERDKKCYKQSRTKGTAYIQ